MFSFHIPGKKGQLFPDSTLWNMPLAGKKALSAPQNMDSAESGMPDNIISVGDYFTAAERFLSDNNFNRLKKIIELMENKPVPVSMIIHVSIFLEKHGAFYHPLRVKSELQNGTCCVSALNGAVSNHGLALLEDEYRLISKLNSKYGFPWIPRVSDCAVEKTGKGRIGFFSGQWFEGFREFHVSGNHGTEQIAVWHSNGNCHYMSQHEAFGIYREISRILTLYYDIETFEQIISWHHAAGDFVFRIKQGQPEVRLVTIRGYEPVMQLENKDEDKRIYILPSLMFFFFNLSLRIRIDRRDGTKEPVLLGEKIISAALEGFLRALEEKSAWRTGFRELKKGFAEFVRQFSTQQIITIFQNMMESCLFDQQEENLIRKNLEHHCSYLFSCFKTM